MKRHTWFYVFCLAASTALAAAVPTWPKVIRNLTERDFKAISVTHIPKGISLYNRPDETPQQREQRVLHIASIDLNDDSVPELLVQADAGGSAGAYYDVYQKQNGSYKHLGSLGAGFGIKLLSMVGGYCQLEFWSRGGGGSYTRQLFQFVNGEYRCVRIDDFRGYEGTYIGTRKPNE